MVQGGAETGVGRGPPPVTYDARQQLIDRLRSSETLRDAIRRLGHDPDELAEVLTKRAAQGETVID